MSIIRWWRQYAPLKHRFTSTKLHGTSQKAVMFIFSVMRTWNLTMGDCWAESRAHSAWPSFLIRWHFGHRLPSPAQYDTAVCIKISGVQSDFSCFLLKTVHTSCCPVQHGSIVEVSAMTQLIAQENFIIVS